MEKTNRFLFSLNKIEKKVLNLMIPLRYELLCQYLNQFTKQEIDLFMLQKGFQIFKCAILSVQTLELMLQKVSMEVLGKIIQTDDYAILKTYFWCQKCRIASETKEKQQKRIKILEMLLIIDKYGIQNFIKTYNEAEFMTEEFIKEITNVYNGENINFY